MDGDSPHLKCLMHERIEGTLTDHGNWLKGLDNKFTTIIVLLVLNLGGVLLRFIIH